MGATMKRGTPLKRAAMKRPVPGTKSKNRKRKSKYARRARDVPYMMFVKTLPCLLAGIEGAGPCSGVVEADHAGDRGMGQKADDSTCVPLCSGHHRHRHGCLGFFRGRERQWKREWRANAIKATQENYRRFSEGIEHAVF